MFKFAGKSYIGLAFFVGLNLYSTKSFFPWLINLFIHLLSISNFSKKRNKTMRQLNLGIKYTAPHLGYLKYCSFIKVPTALRRKTKSLQFEV